MLKYIGAYGKQTFAVNLRHHSKAIQEAKKCAEYFSRIEDGLIIASLVSIVTKEWTAKVSAFCDEWSWSYSTRQE